MSAIGIASDHAGVALKAELRRLLESAGHLVTDFGPGSGERVDYPDYAVAVAHKIGNGIDLGILVCGTGIGMSIAANKVAGVRAALCRTEFEAKMARAHNDANVLCLGERVTGSALALAIAEAFVAGRFEGGRHSDRVDKIGAIERGWGSRST